MEVEQVEGKVAGRCGQFPSSSRFSPEGEPASLAPDKFLIPFDQPRQRFI